MERSFRLTEYLFSDILGPQLKANRAMEEATMIEFRGNAAPETFRRSVEHLRASIPPMEQALAEYDALLSLIDEHPMLPAFRDKLGTLLSEAGEFRVPDASRTSFQGLKDVMETQRKMLGQYHDLSRKAVRQFEDAQKYAADGRFVETMLASKAPFASTYERLVQFRSDFLNFYTSTCMVSIDAAMQVFPEGYEFLRGPKDPLPDPQDEAPEEGTTKETDNGDAATSGWRLNALGWVLLVVAVLGWGLFLNARRRG